MQVIETPKAGERREYEMLVGGAWTAARSGKTFESINPYTGREWATVPEADEEDVATPWPHSGSRPAAPR